MLASVFSAHAAEKTTPVADENYSMAETDGVMEGYVKKIAEATGTDGRLGDADDEFLSAVSGHAQQPEDE